MPEQLTGARYTDAPAACGVCGLPFAPDDPVIVLNLRLAPSLRYPGGSIADLALHDRLECRTPVGRWLAETGQTLPDQKGAPL